MNVVDALFVTLGLNTEDFDTNQKQAMVSLRKFSEEATKRSEQVADSGKKAAGYFAGLKIEILGALAAFGATEGIKSFVTSMTEGQAALGRFSKNVNMKPQDVAAWGAVAKEMGDSSQAAQAAIQGIASGIAEASLNGSSALTLAAKANGINLFDKATGKALDYQHAILSLSAALSKMPRQQAMVIAGQIPGASGMFNELMLGPEELQKRLAAASKLTGVTQASTAAAQELLRQWIDVGLRIDVVKEKIYAKLEPALISIGNRFAAWLDTVNFQPLIDGISQFANWVANIDWNGLFNRFTQFIGWINDTAKALGGWKVIGEILVGLIGLKMGGALLGAIVSFTQFGALIIGTTAGMTGLAAAITAVAGAFAGLAIYHGLMEGNKLGDAVGAIAASGMALLGDDDAKKALIDKKWGDMTASQRVGWTDVYKSLDAKGKADYRKKSPEFMRLIDQEISQDNMTPKNSILAPGDGAAVSSTRSLHFGDPQKLADFLQKQTGVPAKMLMNTFRTESSSGKNLKSPAGALGPMQLMPRTAAYYGLNASNVMDLDKSMGVAAIILKENLKKFHGSIPLAAAAYNAGAGNVSKYGGIPPFAETQAYVEQITKGIGPSATVSNSQSTSHSTVDKSSEVHIGTIHVNAPKATDANGVASAIGGAIKNHDLVALTTTGQE